LHIIECLFIGNMGVYTTEIASDRLISDNPVHQRLLKPYAYSREFVKGRVLELGCGEGRGIEMLLPSSGTYLGIDKIPEVVNRLGLQYPGCKFQQMHFPPFTGISDNSFDSVISFQVIEHIKKDRQFLQEINRVLMTGGIAIITTPNRKMSLSRNPWHVREYLADELLGICREIFSKVTILGISGNQKVMQYYNENKESVQRMTRFDILNLQYLLPSVVLRLPYEILNRINRNRLKNNNSGLVNDITFEDYQITENPDEALDLLCIMHK
jgi:SAM-dependent methyltransferase